MLIFSMEIELKEVNGKVKNCESYAQMTLRPS